MSVPTGRGCAWCAAPATRWTSRRWPACDAHAAIDADLDRRIGHRVITGDHRDDCPINDNHPEDCQSTEPIATCRVSCLRVRSGKPECT